MGESRWYFVRAASSVLPRFFGYCRPAGHIRTPTAPEGEQVPTVPTVRHLLGGVLRN
jgi:hypothetical protein